MSKGVRAVSYEEKVSDWFDTSQALGEVLIIAEKADKEIAKLNARIALTEANFEAYSEDKNHEIAELKANNKRLRDHIRQGMEPAEHNYECEVYMEECWAILEETKSQSLREIGANAIKEAAESVSDELVKEEFPMIQALAMGRFYSDIICYADKLREES